MFKSYALENLKNDPLKYFKLYIKKILSFFFLDLDSLYPNYYNFFHLVPKVLISILTLFGLIYYDKKNYYLNIVLFLLTVNILLFSVFFILPRYSLAILPLQMIIITAFIDNLFRRKYKKN